jgi:nucleotide-binding universal stress UspA family protein
MTAISKILVAVDFSENSARALEAAIDYAKKFGATIDIVHAFNIPIPAVYPYEVAVPDSLITEGRQIAKQKLAADKEEVEKAGIAAETRLAEAPAAGAIVRVAEELGSDLLVMGTRGNTGLKHIVLGSVAERTLRHSPCSVLIVK